MILWVLASLIASAIGFVTWIFSGDAKDDRQHMLGFNVPEMQPHWERVATKPSLHNLKNITTEWVRLSAQRASKFLCFLVLINFLAFAATLAWSFI